MRKLKIANEEWYPVHVPDEERYGAEIEVTDEELVRINKAFDEFAEVQALLYEKLPENRRG